MLADGPYVSHHEDAHEEASVDERLSRVAARELLHQYGVCPLDVAGDGRLRVMVAAADAWPVAQEMAFAIGTNAHVIEADQSTIAAAIERRTYHRQLPRESAADADHDRSLDDARDMAEQPPIVRFVGRLLRDAISDHASDIHLDSSRDALTVRVRVDGLLVDGPAATGLSAAAVLSRLKLLANLDIAERRRPQDGRIRVRIGIENVDLRLATVPTVDGESAVVRVLDSRRGIVPLTALGLPQAMLTRLSAAVARPSGLVVVTGPTGSGKTTTLYSALATRTGRGEKLVSVEDPVEIQLPGVTQIPIHRDAGVTFASALRSVLRHDPDVILIGELRDAETAGVAVQAALTGHLVLATLHTIDAPGAVARLLDLGVPHFLVAETLVGVLAQRLVRRLCTGCPTARTDMVDTAAPVCQTCRGTGYAGRVGVFEYLEAGDELRARILASASRDDLVRAARGNGWQPLAEAAGALVSAGITSVSEVRRAIHGS